MPKNNGLDFEELQLRIHPAASRVKLLSREPLHRGWAHITEIPDYPALATYGRNMAQMGVLLPCYG